MSSVCLQQQLDRDIIQNEQCQPKRTFPVRLPADCRGIDRIPQEGGNAQGCCRVVSTRESIDFEGSVICLTVFIRYWITTLPEVCRTSNRLAAIPDVFR